MPFRNGNRVYFVLLVTEKKYFNDSDDDACVILNK